MSDELNMTLMISVASGFGKSIDPIIAVLNKISVWRKATENQLKTINMCQTNWSSVSSVDVKPQNPRVIRRIDDDWEIIFTGDNCPPTNASDYIHCAQISTSLMCFIQKAYSVLHFG